MGIEPAFQRAVTVRGLAVARDSHQHHALAGLGRPDVPRHLVAIHPRDPDVHQDDLRRLRAQGRGHGLETVGRDLHLMAADLQQTAHGLASILVVFDDEYVAPTHGLNGTRGPGPNATLEKFFSPLGPCRYRTFS